MGFKKNKIVMKYHRSYGKYLKYYTQKRTCRKSDNDNNKMKEAVH